MKLKIYNQKGLLAGLGLVVLGSLNLYFQLTGSARLGLGPELVDYPGLLVGRGRGDSPRDFEAGNA